ncbi:MAG: cell division protein FtsA [Candidatus Portnoybacteria bacterium CG_4_8_14_3_um_filter_40_10]|uniref:Cell division protein FtsA n=1 Tax=Candidatus Portnoybacteria bacterium CG_4_8_14_3_um_filter_40_10 TaxID=1974801 RepID=A0A2M7IHY0_9BACT|nr:MAG: cell division protein FtsA [Candidatus Portnoybacteria bacterium CG08_land_8_20_14_0_20_40_83]PIW76105.1 MAG: cell division protein FtsA [Candidatus Portnoybacteria bacterium CG_4_8_14_3_um_filter_40_10]
MPRQKIIIGLDVGSSNIRVAVAEEGKEPAIPFQILGVGQSKALGMRKGAVIDLEETAKNIKEAVAVAERISGIKVESATISLGGDHLGCRSSRGVIAVSRADGEISQEDTERAVRAAAAISLGANREIIQIVPKQFSVDSQQSIKDPVGMRGVRLEVDVLILDGSTPFIKNLLKAIGEAEIETEALVPSPLAAAKAVLDRRQKELGVLVLDLGSATTGFCVFEEGDIIDSCVLPVGSGHITNDLAIGLRTSIDVAEKIKLEYGSVLPDEINKKETISLEKLGGEPGNVSRQKVAEIIEARVAEIFDLAQKRLKQIDRAGLLPAGVVLVGGGAKLPGLVDLAKERLRLPAQIGFPVNFEGVIEEVDDPCFATVLGLILCAGEQSEELRGRRSNVFDFSSLAPVVKKFKNWFKSFLP